MPIVASMGGNAGTQTMTVTVRAIASRELDHFNMGRLIGREALVGLLNGIVFAVVMGIIASLWFENYQIGLVIGIAMIINLIAAGIAGILIPLTLDRLKIDPAVASSAFGDDRHRCRWIHLPFSASPPSGSSCFSHSVKLPVYSVARSSIAP